jgi:hypothetical protein
MTDDCVFAFSLDDSVNNGIGIYKVNGSGALTACSGSADGTALGLGVTDGQRFRAGIAWSGAGASASASVNGLAGCHHGRTGDHAEATVHRLGAQPPVCREPARALTHVLATPLSDAELMKLTGIHHELGTFL